ncbi:MAG: type IV secretory system conjugative DNA transfer family protein [Clostridia bacterium]|nr:type IV secretory system conjugative DNA transfer family protein [Clostridia bacterium]
MILNRKSIAQRRTSHYVKEYLENSQQIHYHELTRDRDGLVTVYYDELQDTEVNGYPIASDYIDENGKSYSNKAFLALSPEQKNKCRLRFHYLGVSHELYVGTTGSGKTTGCIEPQLRAISKQKNKPNIFVTDPKGELFEHNSRHLAENGYRIFLLNFKDITRSNKWNPLLEIYDKQIVKVSLGKDCLMKTGLPSSSDYELYAPLTAFDGETYIVYENRAFPDTTSFDNYVAFRRDYLDAEIRGLVNQFASSIITVKSTKDPTWEQGAQQLLKGIIMCMLEDAVDEKSGFTRDMMTFFTIQKYYDRLRNDLCCSNPGPMERHPLLKNKSRDTIVLLNIALNNALNTMKSYCGVFESSTKDWFQGHIYALTTGCTIDLDSDDDRPYAVFLITRDYDKSDFTVAGMFVDWVYRNALEKAEASIKGDDGKPSTRPIHFLLDEFGNIPEIPDFENKIATSRSRNIWFHLVVQSYEQIDLVYGKDKARVIVDNCNAQIFLGAQSRATKERFSQECGKHFVPSLESYFNPVVTTLQEVAVIPISTLDLISEGNMYIKRLYKSVIQSQYIRSYVCAENGAFKHFRDTFAYRDFAPVNIDPFTSGRYVFKALYEDPDDDDWF